jgi:hypothetical protein
MSSQFAIWDAVALLPPDLQNRPRDFYSFAADFVNVLASAVTSQDVKISDDADFILVYQTAVVTNVAGTTFFNPAPFTVLLKDAGSGRDLMNAPVHINNVFGTGAQPAVVPNPKLLFRASTYTITVANLDAGAAYTVRLGLVGFKLYGPRLTSSY